MSLSRKTNSVIQLSWSWLTEYVTLFSLKKYHWLLFSRYYHNENNVTCIHNLWVNEMESLSFLASMRTSCATTSLFQTENIIFSRNFWRDKYRLSQFEKYPQFETVDVKKRVFFLDFLEKWYSLYCQGRLSLIQFKRSLSSMVFFWKDWISRIPYFRVSQSPQSDMIKVQKRLMS